MPRCGWPRWCWPAALRSSRLTRAQSIVTLYRSLGGAPPKAIVAVHLMLTPEAVRRVTTMHPGVRVYGGRLDRGLSSPRALASAPGAYPDEERGLNDVQYIVPGAGGMGELLTNSWV